MTDSKQKILIVGAGIAGLTAANYLKKAGKDVLVLEASDHIGGRVHTEYKDGFILDRGFQVLLTAYPEAKKILDYEALKLKSFVPGSIILGDLGRTFMGDPSRYYWGVFSTLMSWAATFSDKLLVRKLTNQVKAMSVEEIFAESPQMPTINYLQQYGFSSTIITHFFRPFFGGIFLERAIDTPHPMFLFVMKMFAEGQAAIPENGMAEIPKQLASVLKDDEIKLNTKIVNFDMQYAIDEEDTAYPYSHLIVATPGLTDKKRKVTYKQTTQIYFSSDHKPFSTNAIALNGMEGGLFNNMAVLTNLHKGFAPEGKELISVSLPGERIVMGMKIEDQIRQEMTAYCPITDDWKVIGNYFINHALPEFTEVRNDMPKEEYMIGQNVYLCGDYLLNASLNAAMKSGRLVAEAILGKSQ